MGGIHDDACRDDDKHHRGTAFGPTLPTRWLSQGLPLGPSLWWRARDGLERPSPRILFGAEWLVLEAVVLLADELAELVMESLPDRLLDGNQGLGLRW